MPPHTIPQQYSPNPITDVNASLPPDNPRFRSFAERYVIERCREWKEGEINERAWSAILEARSIYNKVREFSRTVSGR